MVSSLRVLARTRSLYGTEDQLTSRSSRDSHPLEWQLASLHGHSRQIRCAPKTRHVRYPPFAMAGHKKAVCREGPQAVMMPLNAIGPLHAWLGMLRATGSRDFA